MEKKYNCFECEGLERGCPVYLNTSKDLFNLSCDWKKVAKEDLKKYESGEGDITLDSMLEEFLKKNKIKTLEIW